jgi:hypothetical protein
MVDIVVDKAPSQPVELGLARLEQALGQVGAKSRRLDAPSAGSAEAIVAAGLLSGRDGGSEMARRLGAVPAAAAESLAVRRATLGSAPVIAVAGADERGLMYALLDLAQRVGWVEKGSDPFARVRETTESPFTTERSMSIYTMHRGVWESRLHDRDHWRRTFEMMAESRLNAFVVVFGYENGGYMAPAYPYFFDIPEFPAVRVVGLAAAEQARNAESLRAAIDIAHGCGVRFVAGLWDHIYRGWIQDGGIPDAPAAGEERHGIVVGVTGENVGAYNRAAIARFLELFPGLDGLQLRMHNESGLRPDEMGPFWHAVFVAIREKRPELRLDLRAKELPDEIIDDALGVGVNVRIATKYWMEQMGLPFHPTHVNVNNQHDRRHGYADLLRKPRRFAMHWRLWNSITNGGLLWADPAWVRRFVATTRLRGESFDFNEPNATWMLGRPHQMTPLPVLSERCRTARYEVERHWHTLQLFGRLGYDPATPAETWEREFARRFGAAAPHVMQALHASSVVTPRIVGAAYCYALFATTMGCAARDSQGPLPEFALAEGSDVQQFVSLRDEADLVLGGGATARRRPGATAQWFARAAERILAAVEAADRAARSPGAETTAVLTDARILAHLARFYATRIPAAVAWNLHARTGDLWALDDAIAGERAAIEEWRLMEQAAAGVYADELPIGIRRPGLHGHWRDERARLEQGLAELERYAAAREGEAHPCGLAHVPVRRLATGEDLVIRASVPGPEESRNVAVSILAPGGRPRRWPLQHERGGRYRGVVPAAELPARFAYAVDVQWSWGHRIATPGGIEDPIRVVVSDDSDAPVVEHTPVARARAGEPVRVGARVSDPSGVEWVRLRYRHLCQLEDYASVPMRRSGDRYEAEIPGSFVTAEWDLQYFVEAMDCAGNGAIHPDLEIASPYVIVEVLPVPDTV